MLSPEVASLHSGRSGWHLSSVLWEQLTSALRSQRSTVATSAPLSKRIVTKVEDVFDHVSPPYSSQYVQVPRDHGAGESRASLRIPIRSALMFKGRGHLFAVSVGGDGAVLQA